MLTHTAPQTPAAAPLKGDFRVSSSSRGSLSIDLVLLDRGEHPVELPAGDTRLAILANTRLRNLQLGATTGAVEQVAGPFVGGAGWGGVPPWGGGGG